MDAGWRIELLGGLRVTQADAVDGRVITRFRTQKSGELLAYLACHLSRSHAREELIELLWPECDLDAGRNRLSNALSGLRHQLEPPGVPTGGVLQADRGFVRLNPAVVATDVAAFEAAVQSAAAASSHLERAQFLTAALDLYRGPLLPGYYADWLSPEQERLAALHLRALLQLADCCARAGEPERALEYARRAVAADPLREETHRELMRLHLAAGQPAAALQQYHQLEQVLRDELGAAPAPESRALAQQAGRSRKDEGGMAQRAPDESEPSEPSVPVPLIAFRLPPSPNPPITLPTGTVTFLLTDIQGSTAAYERDAEAYREALAGHHALLRGEFRRHGGHEAHEAGDSFIAAFAAARDALECAVASQRRLAAHAWPEATGPLRVRMALHTGDVELKGNEYEGLALHRASRILTAAHGGQIVCSEAAAALLRRDLEADLRLVDLGIYRLRDVPSPERLFQVAYPDMPQRQFPPLRAEAGFAGNLPPSFSRFFGRESELSALVAMLAPSEGSGFGVQGSGAQRSGFRVQGSGGTAFGSGGSEPEPRTLNPEPSSPEPRTLTTRLVTLTGPGGTGKTRLALETARQLAERFAGSVWFVPLGEVEGAERVMETALAALRLPRAPQVEPLEQLVEVLSQHPSLLVLDNFEQLVAGGATLVHELLARAPALYCLVTSRQRLDVAGEREFVVQPLPRPGGGAEGWTPEQLLAFESVQLFVDRAQAVKPDFQVTPANAGALAELCDRLEGIPLAVELAAARAQLLTPAQMVAQLSRRFDFLVSRRRDAPERQRTLRGAIDWSYQLLAPEPQQFFARLSVFRGGWTLSAAEAVCECVSDWVIECEDRSAYPTTQSPNHSITILDALAELRDGSLVLVDEAHEGMRFGMLETLREYAAEKLGPEESREVRRRHREYYLALAEEAREELRGPRQAAWLERLDLELPNLRAALAASLDPAGADLESALRLGGALWRLWSTRGYAREGLEALRGILARVPAEHPSLGGSAWRAEALNGAGALAHDLGDDGAARRSHEESLALWRELADPAGQASALNNLGNLAFDDGEYDAAGSWYEEALRLYRAAGDTAGAARVLSNLGALAQEQGDPGRGAQLAAESLDLRRALGDQYGVAVSLENLGHLERERGDLARAAELHAEALALRRELDHKQGIAISLNNLGSLRLEQDDPAGAGECFRESLALLRELTEPRATAECLAGLAGAAAAEGRHAQAARLLGALAALRGRSGVTPSPVEAAAEGRADRSARAALGERAYAAAREEGKRLPPEEAAA